MPLELSEVYIQRIRVAVEAAKKGVDVRFRIYGTFPPKQIAWYDADKPGSRHVILNAHGDAERWRDLVESKYLEMLVCADKEV